MPAVHRGSNGELYDHVKVSAPDHEALVTTNILNLPISDSMDITYDASGLMTRVDYKLGGVDVGNMILTYSGSLISNVVVNNLVD